MTTTQTIKKTDAQIKTDVLSELEYEPYVKVTDIGVLVENGTVTLRGNVRNFAELDEAARVAWAAPGVSDVDNQLNVKSVFDESR